jgi:hypothetical protein
MSDTVIIFIVLAALVYLVVDSLYVYRWWKRVQEKKLRRAKADHPRRCGASKENGSGGPAGR